MKKHPLPSEIVHRTGIQSETDPLEYVMSSSDVDRMSDVIDPEGIKLTAFKQNPIALWQHRSDQPIGVWKNVRVEGEKLIGKLHLAAIGTSELINTIHSLVEQRILRAVSIGFRPIEYEDILDKKGNWTGGFLFKKVELLECSLVSVPANANALTLAKAHGLGRDDLSKLFPDLYKRGNEDRKPVIADVAPSEEVVKRVLATRPSLQRLF